MTRTHLPRSIDDLQPGDHLCCLYKTEEEYWPPITTFVRQGFERDEQILYITDTRPVDAILECLLDNGLDATTYLDSGQMVIISGDDIYLQQDTFDSQGLIDLMKTRIEQAQADGYQALRIIGEMSWVLWDMPSSEQWAEYEAALDELLLNGQCLSLCGYDRRLFGTGVLLDALYIHPLAIIEAEVYENLYYTPVADLQDRDQSAAALQRRVENVIAHQRAEEALRKARDELEIRVQERTAELAQTNKELQVEIAERKRAEEALKRRVTQLALLNDIGGKIAAISDLEGVLDRASRLVQEEFDYHHVGLFTLDQEQGELVMRTRAGDFAHLYPPEHRLKVGQGIVGWVGESGERLLANDVKTEPRYVNLYPDVVPTRSELSIPIKVGPEVIGVLDVQSPQRDAFDESDVMVIETLADQVAVAIENARLYETVRQELAEREQAERTLSRRAAQLALLSDIGSKIAAVSDLEGVFDRAARLVQESFGYHHVGLFTLDREQGELVMRAKAGDFVDLYPPNHRLKVNQGMVGWVGRSCQSLLANDVDAESRYVNLYPNVVPTRSELCVPILVSGEIVGVLDIQSPNLDAFDENDVTALETLASQIAVAIEGARLYEALRVSEERYRAVSRLAADFAYAIEVDSDGSIEFEWVTAAFSRLTGYTEGEIEGRDGWKRVIYPDDLPMVLAHLEERLSGQSNEAEYRILTKDGQIRWWHDYGRPEWDKSQEHVVRIYGAAQDITERKRMEEYMLHTERLAAMGHMAAALTHEIESPLKIIQEHLSLALQPDIEPVDQTEHLRLCQQEIEHLSEIADRVLGLAQPVEDAARPASIDDLIRRTLALLKKPLLRAPFEIKIEIPTDLPPVQIVPDRIVQALVNLMINSIEAMPDGGEMHIAAHQDEDKVVLTLTNDGPHIPPDDIEQVFDPFFTTKAEGAGLGLYISQNIVEQHDGTIGVENLPGDRGVAFTVTLPAADST